MKAGSLKRYQNWEMFSHNDKGKKKMHITKIINESGDIASNLTEIRILWITVHYKLEHLDEMSKFLEIQIT